MTSISPPRLQCAVIFISASADTFTLEHKRASVSRRRQSPGRVARGVRLEKSAIASAICRGQPLPLKVVRIARPRLLSDEELVRDFIVCVEFVRGRDGRREWWVFVHVDEGASAAQSAEASRVVWLGPFD